MKIVFIYNGAEHLGIEYISSFLKSKGHEVFLLFDPAIFSGHQVIDNHILSRILNVEKDIIKKIYELKPELIAFSTFTGNYIWCLSLAKKIKQLYNVPIVFGGVHTSAVVERVLSHNFIDYAIIGEGEFPLSDLADYLAKGANPIDLSKVPNICFKYKDELYINSPRPYIKDLDILPFPDKSLFYEKVPLFEEQYLIISSRGCPYSCTYCSNDMYHNLYNNEPQHLRRRSPDNVIEELLYIKKQKRMKLVVFADDMFISSKTWLETFIEKYKSEINLPFFCNIHPLNTNKEIISLLKDGGCWLVTMGIQSGSERIRKTFFDRKGTNSKIIEIIHYIKEAGIKISIDNIFGSPTENENDLKLSLQLYNKIKPDRIITFWLTFYPKTRIIDYAKEHNILTDNDIEKIEKGHTGFTHEFGAVSKDKISIYLRYELLFQLRALLHNDSLYSLFSPIIKMPFKKIISKIILLLNAFKNRDRRFFNLLRYILVKKNVP